MRQEFIICDQTYLLDCDQEVRMDGKREGGVTTLSLSLSAAVGTARAVLLFGIRKYGCAYVWSSQARMVRKLAPDWSPNAISFRSVEGIPILSLADANDINIATVSVVDPDTPCTLSAGFSEETGQLNFRVEIGGNARGVLAVVIDERALPFSDCVQSAAARFAGKVRQIPEAAKLPVYSTWYSDHQRLNRNKILEDCKEAKALGMQVVIIDDGWQTEDASYGYGYCGDYEPATGKIGDMGSLIEELHAIGMKVMLWYSVSFLGEYSAAMPRFADKTLSYKARSHCYVLDPRFPEVRAFICDFLCRSAKRWKIDGLKLDFIDSFALPPDLAEREGVDCTSIEEGIRRLLSDIQTSLLRDDPDFMIEFRQSYIGPSMRTVATMLRVRDCPGDFLTNRMGVADLKLTSGKTPVHCDPIMFLPSASPEHVATLLANVIFSVIQFSVTPKTLTKAQAKVVTNYLRFCKKYRNILLDGTFSVRGGGANYTQLRATDGTTDIVGCYSGDSVVELSRGSIVVNGSDTGGLYVNALKPFHGRILDCYGNTVSECTLNGLQKVSVPIGGMLFAEAK